MIFKFDHISNRCREIVDRVMSSPSIPEREDLRIKFRLCTEEVVNNIISYAYDGSDGWMQIGIRQEGNTVLMEFKDGGIAFNPLEASSPDLDVPILERKIGGLGIHFIKNVMDELHYERKEGMNILTAIKKLPVPGAM